MKKFLILLFPVFLSFTAPEQWSLFMENSVILNHSSQANISQKYNTPMLKADTLKNAVNCLPEKFAGKWYVVATNYKFWKNKNRSHPVINLDLLNDEKGRTFLSRVTYKWKDCDKTITGYETRDNSTRGRFVWQGKGLLSIIKNEWYLVALADDYSWAFTYFPKSNIGTPEGVDILSRTPEMSEELLQKIISQVREDEFMKAKTEGIFRCEQ